MQEAVEGSLTRQSERCSSYSREEQQVSLFQMLKKRAKWTKREIASRTRDVSSSIPNPSKNYTRRDATIGDRNLRENVKKKKRYVGCVAAKLVSSLEAKWSDVFAASDSSERSALRPCVQLAVTAVSSDSNTVFETALAGLSAVKVGLCCGG